MWHRTRKRSAAGVAAVMAIGMLGASMPLGAAAQDSTPPPAADCARSDARTTRCRCGSAAAATRAWSTSWSRLERGEPGPQDQPDLHPAHRDGGQDRPGDRHRRGAGPDGHGPDLRARSSRTPASSSTSPTRSATSRELKTASPGHMAVATYDGRLYGVPLYADVSALFYNKDLFQAGRARPGQAADQPRRDRASTPTRSPRSAAT